MAVIHGPKPIPGSMKPTPRPSETPAGWLNNKPLSEYGTTTKLLTRWSSGIHCKLQEGKAGRRHWIEQKSGIISPGCKKFLWACFDRKFPSSSEVSPVGVLYLGCCVPYSFLNQNDPHFLYHPFSISGLNRALDVKAGRNDSFILVSSIEFYIVSLVGLFLHQYFQVAELSGTSLWISFSFT